MSKSCRKMPPGTWVERDLFTSPAYLELTGFAPQLLVLFLAKRDIDKKEKKARNKDNITMTFVELEKFYIRHEAHGQFYHMSTKGISRPRVVRAFDNLLAHGFIKIVHQGGAYQRDKTVYALAEDWRLWRPGMTMYSREPDTRKRGYNGRNLKVAHETVPIHTNETVPIGDGLH